MSKTITKRLFIRMLLVTVAFSIMLLVANSLLLKPLYYNSVRSSMTNVMDDLLLIDYSSDSDLWIDEIKTINSGKNLDIAIETKESLIYSSSMDIGIQSGPEEMGELPIIIAPKHNDGDIREPKEPFYFRIPEDAWEVVSEGVDLDIFTEPENNNEMFVFRGRLDDSMTIYIFQSVEPILQSIQQANYLLFAVTFLFMIITSAVAFRLSRDFTKPIRQMQTYVGHLSKLEFNRDCEVATGDELQSLNEDIGVLASALEEALLELQEKNRQLTREIKAQRKFISNASHELRTPLSLIKGYADEINAGFVTNRDQEHKYLGYIAEESAKMKRLLNEILELSRRESGRMTYEPQKFRVDEAITGFLDKYNGFVEEQRLKLTMDIEPCEGIHDPMSFEQILANYLSNTSKYSDQKKEVRISCTEHEATIRVEVFNTGAHISEEAMPYLWDGFYKADEARTNDRSSYGLGLSIVKAIQGMAGQAYGVENVSDGVIFWYDVKKV